MGMMGRAVLLLLALVMFWAPLTTAQGLPAPTARIELEGLPADGAIETSNETFHITDFKVRLVLENLVCSTANVPVLLSATAIPLANSTGNGSTRLTTDRLTFEVDEGAYTSQTSPYSETMEVTLSVLATGMNPPGGQLGATFTARMEPSADRYGCAGTGGLPGAHAQRNFTVDFALEAPPVPPPTPTTKVPGPDLVIAFVALVGALLVMSLRRP